MTRIEMKNKSEKNINYHNSLLRNCIKNVFEKLTETEQQSVIDEHFDDVPFVDDIMADYEKLSNLDKLLYHFDCVLGFCSKSRIVKEYDFWKSLEPKDRKNYYNTIGRLGNENLVISDYEEFTHYYNKKEYYNANVIGVLELDTKYTRTSDVILQALAEYLELNISNLDVFSNLEDLEKIIDYTCLEYALEIFKQNSYEKVYLRKLAKKQREKIKDAIKYRLGGVNNLKAKVPSLTLSFGNVVLSKNPFTKEINTKLVSE